MKKICKFLSPSPWVVCNDDNDNEDNNNNNNAVERIVAPTELEFSVGGQAIGSEIEIPLGEFFQIDITVDHLYTTHLLVDPPLPSSLSLSLTALQGNLTTPLNLTYVLTAINSKGSVNRTLHLYTEICSEEFYYVRYRTGSGRGKVTVNSKVLFEYSVTSSTIVPFCIANATVVMEYTCTSPEGCWYSLYHNDAHLPPIFVHYNDHDKRTIALPTTSFSSTVVTDFITVVEGQWFSVFWEQKGFVKSVEMIDSPEQVYYDELEHALYGQLPEMGDYGLLFAVNGEKTTDLLEVMINVLPEIDMNRTISITVEMMNDEHAKSISLFASDGNTTEVMAINGRWISTHRILQPVMVYGGLVNITDLQ